MNANNPTGLEQDTVMKREAHVKRMDNALKRAYERYKKMGGIKNMRKFGLVHLVHNKSIAQMIYEEMEEE